MPQYDNIGGIWRETKNIYDNIGGIWKEAKNCYDNIGGVYREFHKSGVPISDLPLGTYVYVPKADGGTEKMYVLFKNRSGYPAGSITLYTLDKPWSYYTAWGDYMASEIYYTNNTIHPNHKTTLGYTGFHFTATAFFSTLATAVQNICLDTTISFPKPNGSTSTTMYLTTKCFNISTVESTAAGVTLRGQGKTSAWDAGYGIVQRDPNYIQYTPGCCVIYSWGYRRDNGINNNFSRWDNRNVSVFRYMINVPQTSLLADNGDGTYTLMV